MMALLLVLTIWAWSRPFGPGHKMFRLAHLGLIAWLAFATLQLASPSLDCQILWMSMTTPALTFTTMAWSLFLVDFSPQPTQVSIRCRYSMLGAATLAVLFIALTNSWHKELFGNGTLLAQVAGRPSAIIERGIFYYLLSLHNYGWVFFASVISIKGYRKSNPSFRPLFAGLLAMTLVPVGLNASYNLAGLTVFGVDPTPFGLVISIAIYSWLLVFNRLLDVSLVGEQHIYRDAQVFMVVCNRSGSMVSTNPFAKKFLDGPQGNEAREVLAEICRKLQMDAKTLTEQHVAIGESIFQPYALRIDDPVHCNRPFLGWTVTLIDVTREEEIAKALIEAKERAEEMTRLQTELIAVISHELRTPLTSISGTLALLDAGQLGELQGQARRGVEIARRNCARLAKLIDNLLDLQKLEARRLELKFESIDLRYLLSSSLEELEGYAQQRPVHLVVTETDRTIEVLTDATRLKQIITNVISNAIKFSPEDGTVVTSLRKSGAMAELCISDQGPGIPAGAEAKVFGRFAQVDSSSSRGHEGTGLGMNISKLMIEQLGGEIFYRSEIGTGTTFFLKIPLSEAARKKHIP
ncbi:histidine kinase N-terminal 7TM domain-containing protein [Salipiger sp. IMCC34102]|uniref:sensor histidine kinase n=1 Tax=Salipiger sp. IMCC34102 TaxID=2510647 RepID=UPI003518BCF3